MVKTHSHAAGGARSRDTRPQKYRDENVWTRGGRAERKLESHRIPKDRINSQKSRSALDARRGFVTNLILLCYVSGTGWVFVTNHQTSKQLHIALDKPKVRFASPALGGGGKQCTLVTPLVFLQLTWIETMWSWAYSLCISDKVKVITVVAGRGY